MHVQLGANYGQKIQKDKKTKKTRLPLLKSWEQKNRVLGAKAEYCAFPLHSTPPKWGAKHLSHPSGLTPGHTPTFTPHRTSSPPTEE